MDAINVLTLDGGGMRGLYSANLLRSLAARFAKARGIDELDLGKGFDVVVGTSTGAILAATVAAGIRLDRVTALYEEAGPLIFRDPIPYVGKSTGLLQRTRFWHWVLRHLCRPGNVNSELISALREIFGILTFGDMYRDRGIGLCISSTDFVRHAPRVFKTPHLENKDRDDSVRLVDACLASAAAPIYLPLASIMEDGHSSHVHADGGLWANNPVLLGVIEGLALSAPEQPIMVLSVGTCPPTAGSPLPVKLNRGIGGWRGGVLPLELAMNAQTRAAHHSATLLTEQLRGLGKRVDVLRCEESSPPPDHTHLLQLDSASEGSIGLMKTMGNTDGQETYRWTQNGDRRGCLLTQIFERMPEVDQSRQTEE